MNNNNKISELSVKKNNIKRMYSAGRKLALRLDVRAKLKRCNVCGPAPVPILNILMCVTAIMMAVNSECVARAYDTRMDFVYTSGRMLTKI